MDKLEQYISTATTNIQEDRAATKTLLMNVMKYMQSSDERHKDVGLVAAKYLETLQRSNEQLVKLAAIISRKESRNDGLSENDKEELYDIIKEGKGKDE